MKKLFYSILLILGLTLSCCGYNRPEINISSPLNMTVGDSTTIEVYHAKKVEYTYSSSRDVAHPVFEISDFKGASTTIFALNPGSDTLFVGYRWTSGSAAYERQEGVVINVREK